MLNLRPFCRPSKFSKIYEIRQLQSGKILSSLVNINGNTIKLQSDEYSKHGLSSLANRKRIKKLSKKPVKKSLLKQTIIDMASARNLTVPELIKQLNLKIKKEELT